MGWAGMDEKWLPRHVGGHELDQLAGGWIISQLCVAVLLDT